MVSDVAFADGRVMPVRVEVAADVRGLDRDGHLVVPMGTADHPMFHDDGTEYLVPLTPCCAAPGKGWMDDSGDGVVCRLCYAWVDDKFGGPTTVDVPRVPRSAG